MDFYSEPCKLCSRSYSACHICLDCSEATIDVFQLLPEQLNRTVLCWPWELSGDGADEGWSCPASHSSSQSHPFPYEDLQGRAQVCPSQLWFVASRQPDSNQVCAERWRGNVASRYKLKHAGGRVPSPLRR